MKRKTGQDRSITRNWRRATQAIRGGTARSEYGETSEAIFMTSGYCYDSAEQAVARFEGREAGMTYSRLQSPTVEMLEERLALLEGAEACRTSSSGMAAMTFALMGTLSMGDHLVAGRSMFGNCRVLVDQILPRFGIHGTTVDGRDPDNFRKALKPETKVIFIETPTNPTLEIVDLRAVANIAKEAGVLLIVDNAFAPPPIQSPLKLGADITAYSATKLLDGQGRTLSGAVMGPASWVEGPYLEFAHNIGPMLSPFDAWLILKSLETLDLRARTACANALAVAEFLEKRVPRVLYPGLQSHPQHELAMSQMDMGGIIIAFHLDGGRKQAHGLENALQLIDISNNLGDTRSLITHPASTTHSGVSPEARAEMGINEGTLRLSVGLEDAQDLIDDLDQALRTVGL
jgi:O-succinylhomoserine sulfhydrylase